MFRFFFFFSSRRRHTSLTCDWSSDVCSSDLWLLGALVFVHFILRAAADAVSADSRDVSLHASALTFIRVYVGLMFVPHFGRHILGGPDQFKIYTLYFASLGIAMPAMQVALAGAIELISAIGLTLGLFTRPVA